ncbi:MAG: T9SS type A sorting domain-containing protein [candidate division Zixibacteria bacterium]|nr:T9SS type A sorting domain-containing protein [Candidatus Tariuqbacter arcticus]
MFTPKRFVICLLVLGILGGWLTVTAQPQNNPLVFHTFTDLTFTVGLPILFENFSGITNPAEDGWILQFVCAGDDGFIDPPVLFGLDIGMPTGDDFLADATQNSMSFDYVNGGMLTFPGCYMGWYALVCLEAGTGTEPVINCGDYVYLRAFNSDHWSTATWYADLVTCDLGDAPFLVPPGNNNPVDVFGCDINPDYILPVELMSFTATPGNNMVTLEWVTASESENKCFHIYRNDEEIVEIETKAVGGESSEPLTYTYIDRQVTNGLEYTYQLTAEDINGVECDLDEVEAVPSWDPDYVVTEYQLHQNYPNPFNPGTTIEYDVLESGKVYLSIYNIKGQEVAKLIDGEYKVGGLKHVCFWSAEALSSGIYFYQVRVNDFKSTKKMVLVQ